MVRKTDFWPEKVSWKGRKICYTTYRSLSRCWKNVDKRVEYLQIAAINGWIVRLRQFLYCKLTKWKYWLNKRRIKFIHKRFGNHAKGSYLCNVIESEPVRAAPKSGWETDKIAREKPTSVDHIDKEISTAAMTSWNTDHGAEREGWKNDSPSENKGSQLIFYTSTLRRISILNPNAEKLIYLRVDMSAKPTVSIWGQKWWQHYNLSLFYHENRITTSDLKSHQTSHEKASRGLHFPLSAPFGRNRKTHTAALLPRRGGDAACFFGWLRIF